MSERQAGPYDSIARRWLALVERRQEHFLELCDTGRWRHYYTQAEFLAEMKKVLRVREQWAALAGVPLHDAVERDEILLQGGRPRPQRHAGAAKEMPTPSWPG